MKNSVLKAFDPSIARLIITVALLCAMESLLVLGIISFYTPYKTDPALAEIFFHYRKGFMPERELQLYGSGIVMAFIFCVGLIYVFRQHFAQPAFRASLKRYCLLHGLIVTVETGFVFALIVTPTAQAMWVSLYGLIGISVIIKIFYIEIDQWFGRIL